MATAEITHPRFGIIARMRTWWIILRIAIDERLVYRGDFMLGTLMRFLPIVSAVFLWGAVYAAIHAADDQHAQAAPSSQKAGPEQTNSLKAGLQPDSGTTAGPQRYGGATVAGYEYNDLIAYLLLTMVARAFSSMPGLASTIARSIRDGTIKKFLIQPVDMLGFLLLGRMAHKLVYYAVAIFPFALVFYLCRGYFTHGWPAPDVLAAFVLSLVMSFLLGYFLEAAIGLIGFWFLEVSSLLFVYMLFSFFLSGQMFPLDMLDKFTLFGSVTCGDLARWSPLQYQAYFPARVFLGRIQGAELAWGLAGQFAWVAVFFVICRVAFARGVRRYSAYGG